MREQRECRRGGWTGWIVIACLLVSAAAMLPGCKRSAPAQQVVLYCSADQHFAEPIVAAFEEQTGIDVIARYDTEASKTVGLVNKIRAEAEKPAADVLWGNEVFYTIQLAQEGLLAPYESEATANWPAAFRDEENLWYGMAIRARVIGYNTEKVPAGQAPKSLENLLDPQWKGRIVMANPDRGTTGGDVASWFVDFGPENARTILERLKTNDILVVEGNSTAIRQVATGQADVCMTDTDDVYAMQRNDAPVALNPLRRNGHGTLAIPNTVARVKGGPNEETAGKLIDFLLSRQVELMLLQSDSHNWPVSFEPGAEYEPYRIPEPAEISYEKISEALPAAKEMAREILR